MKSIKPLIKAWWLRTLPIIDLDNNGKEIQPPTQKKWVKSVEKDIDILMGFSHNLDEQTGLLKQIIDDLRKAREQVERQLL